jgi:transmembrane sensor
MAEDITKQNTPDFKDMNTEQKIMWRSGQFQIPGAIPKEEAYANLMKRMGETNTPKGDTKVVRMPVLRIVAVAAAGFLLLIGLWLGWNRIGREDVIALRGHQSDYRLPDGSAIALNAETEISFNKKTFQKNRVLKMDGEAFFNVEKGNPFTIKTNLANIQVLGTSFNVFARENRFKVSCFTGKIRVTSGSQSVVITPGESADLKGTRLVISRDEDIQTSAQWRNGEFNYVNSPLNFVLEEIERQYNVTFVKQINMNNLYFTGNITNKDLVAALDIICIPMDLTYEIGSNSRIFIKSQTK